MDRPGHNESSPSHTLANDSEANAPHPVQAQVRCSWPDQQPSYTLPAPGTPTTVVATDGSSQPLTGRLAEQGRGGRFLVALGDRPVRSGARLRVSLPATLRSPALPAPVTVEMVDLTTGGARVRGAELPVGTPVTLDFTPPGRHEPVSVRASVAHGTHGGAQPWVGVAFRLVALRGGR
jgi:PilZ domain